MIKNEILEKIPHKTGVYIWKHKNKVLYVGKANNIKKRIEQYFRTGIGVWKENMVTKADNIEYFLTKNEEEALLLEEKLVKKYNPPYNSLLKGNNAYIYIHIGEGKFPKIEFTHFKNKKGTYIGPKPYKKDLKNMFLLLRRILKFRTCSDNKFKQGKLCSDFTLGLCSGRCSQTRQVGHNIDTYPNKLIIDFFKGKTDSIKKLILNKIDKSIKEENFEYASILKDFYLKIEKLSQKQTIEIDKNINGYFIKIRKEKNIYFMVYSKFIEGKLVDIVKLKNDENNFLKEMINDGLIKEYKKIGNNFYYAK